MLIQIEIPSDMPVVTLRPLFALAAELGLHPAIVAPAKPRPGLLEPTPSAAEREARVMGEPS